MTFEIKDTNMIAAAADWLVSQLGSRRIVAFDAPMGAGKTTLIAGIAARLGAADVANSPTFSIVNSYEVPGGKPVYHFDFYRLEKASDVADLGIYDYLDSGSYCLMEWPQVALPYLPEDTVVARIEVNADGSRSLTLLNI